MKKNANYLTMAAMTAAIYVVLCIVFKAISYGPIQIRIAEALAIMPVFTGAAVPGLAVGCLIANMLGGGSLLDVVFGTLATLMGAVGTYLLRRKPVMAPIPPIVANTVIIPWVLRLAYGEAQPILLLMLSVGVGEVLSCGVLGIGLMFLLRRYRDRLFG